MSVDLTNTASQGKSDSPVRTVNSKSLLNVKEAFERHGNPKPNTVQKKEKKLTVWMKEKLRRRSTRKNLQPQRKYSMTSIPTVGHGNTTVFKQTADFICNRWIQESEEQLENQTRTGEKIKKLIAESGKDSNQSIRIERREMFFLKREQELVKADLFTLTMTITELKKLHFATTDSEVKQIHEMNAIHTSWEQSQLSRLGTVRKDLQQANKESKEALYRISATGPPAANSDIGRTQSRLEQLSYAEQEVWEELHAVCQSFELDSHKFLRLCTERRQRDIKDLAKYKVVRDNLELILNEQILIRRAIEDECISHTGGYFIMGANELHAFLDTMKVFEDVTLFPPPYSKQRESLYVELLNIKTVRQAATREMRLSLGIKQLAHESYIREIEGYDVSTEQIGETPISAVYKAKSTIEGEEHVTMAAKVFKLSRLDGKIKAHVKDHSFKVLRHTTRCPAPNIIRILDVLFVSADVVYILEEQLTDTVKLMVIKEGPQKEESVKKYATDITSGISYLHALGVAHQNISPSTVFRTSTGQLKIGFLESASLCWNPKLHKAIRQRAKSSPPSAYIAPETTLSKYDPFKADIYSFGLTLLYLILGDLPCPSKSGSDNLRQWQVMDERLQANISVQGNDLIYNCVNVRPSRRYSIRRVMQHNWFKQSQNATSEHK